MSTFIIRPKDFEPSTVKLDRMKLTIGRSSRNDICISDPFASRLHAELRREGDHVLLVDNGSANGTFLNGQRVSGSVRLEPGDLLSIVSQVGIALLPRTTLEDTLKLTVDLVFQAIPAERGFLFLKEGGDIVCKIARGAHAGALPTASQVQISRSMTNKVIGEGA